MKLIYILLISISIIGLFGCDAGKNKTNVELVTAMMDQVNNKAQDYDELAGTYSNRVPPANTVAIGQKVYKYKGEPDQAASKLRNPYASTISPEDLERGKKYYEIYCGVCHGNNGVGGDSTPVAQKMPIKPPSLVSAKIKNYRDGRIYHAITEGFGMMGSYSRQIVNTEDRWKVISYIRQLQENAK